MKEESTQCHERPVSPLKSVKNEVHNILSILRLTQYVSPRRFTREVLTAHEPPLASKFQKYLQQLSALDEFEASLATVQPFLDVIRDASTSGPITGEALGAINKFVVYNLIRVDRAGAAECINGIADAIINCRFVPSGTVADEVVTLKILNVMIDTLRCPAGDFLSDQNVWAMVKKCYQISRQSRASFLLRSSSENTLQQLILKVFSSWTAASRRQHIQSLVLSQNLCPQNEPEPQISNIKTTDSTSDAQPVNTPYGEVTMNRCLQFLAFLTSYGADSTTKGGNLYPRASRSVNVVTAASPEPANSVTRENKSPQGIECPPPPPPLHAASADNVIQRTSSPIPPALPNLDVRNELLILSTPYTTQEQDEVLKLELRSLGLTLLNVALETGGEVIAQSQDLVLVTQELICKSLLLNSQTESLFVLSMTLRCIFNLFMYLKRHLKVQLEMFFNSLHLRIAAETSPGKHLSKSRKESAASMVFICERRELALESLLEFCREPDLILELYENYDCDIRCTNLFQLLVETLHKIADPFLTSKPHSVPASSTQHRDQMLVYSSLLYKQQRPNQTTSPKTLARVTSLNRLAFAGLAAVCKTLAFRCVWDTRFPYIRPGLEDDDEGDPADEKLEVLKRQRDWKRRLAQGAKIFNSEPFRCLPALQDLQLIPAPATAESMAEFLRTTPGLDMRLIGEYLAKPGNWERQVREAFVNQIDFAGISVVEGLRIFLSTFRLPGEAQQIERILESFAAYYFKQQPVVADMPITPPPKDSKQTPLPEECRKPRWIPAEGRRRTRVGDMSPFSDGPSDAPVAVPLSAWYGHKASDPPEEGATIFLSSDTVFVLSYSIIILNTDLHNNQVKKKMSCEDFLKNNRGINEGEDLSPSYLMSIYTVIKEEELAVISASEHLVVSLMVENREFWDYLLKNSGALGEYSSTLATATVRTQLQTFHHRAMFMILIDEAQLLETLCHVFCSTRDPQVAVDCMMTFGDLIRIATFYKVSEVLVQIAAILLRFFHPILSFKSQMVLPVLFHLFAIASHQLGQDGWSIYLDFTNRLAACGLVHVALDTFPISLRDSLASSNSALSKFDPDEPPTKLEDFARLCQRQNVHWLTELTSLLFSGAQAPPKDDDEDRDLLASYDADSDSDDAAGEDGADAVSPHETALKISVDFWRRCIFFPQELSQESSARIDDLLSRELTSENAIEMFRMLIRDRCNPADFFAGRLRLMPLEQYKEVFKALLLKVFSFTHQEPDSLLPSGHNVKMMESGQIRYIFRRDDAPLLSVDETEFNEYERVVASTIALDHLCKLMLVLSQRRDQARRRSDPVPAPNPLTKRAQSLMTPSPDEVHNTFLDVYVATTLLLEYLLVTFSDDCGRDPEIRDLSISDMAPSISTHAGSRAIVEEVLSKTSDVDATFSVTNLKLVERVVITTLKLCIDLGHHSDSKILGPLTRLFDLICRLKSDYLYPLFFQISSAIAVLLNSAVYSSGLHKTTADLILAVQTDGTSASSPQMPAFFMSILDLVQRVSPWGLLVAKSTKEPAIAIPDTNMSQAGLEILYTMSQSSSFALMLNQILKSYPKNRQDRTCYLSIAHFMRYLVQTFLTYCLPPRAHGSPIADFDLEDTSISGSPIVTDPAPPQQQQPIQEFERTVQQSIALFGILYNGVVSPTPRPTDRPSFADTPSTDDDSDDTNTLEAGAVWHLWAPIAQALAMLSAFGTRDQRRQALMSLQHHLNAMPLTDEFCYGSELAPKQKDACRWTAVVEHILFPLLSQQFLYPFPAMMAQTTPKSTCLLGDNLVNLFPSTQWVLCKLPRTELVQCMMESPQSPLQTLPMQLFMQRKAQSVGFVCRSLLGKLDLIFEESEWIIGDDGRRARCLYPLVIRVLRIFLHEMHGASSGAYDAVVEATKNFLLVLATAHQLECIDDEELNWCLNLLTGQDPRSLVPEPKRPALRSAEAIVTRYHEVFEEYYGHLNAYQNRLFTVIGYLLDVAEQCQILLSIFDVLVPKSRKPPAASTADERS